MRKLKKAALTLTAALLLVTLTSQSFFIGYADMVEAEFDGDAEIVITLTDDEIAPSPATDDDADAAEADGADTDETAETKTDAAETADDTATTDTDTSENIDETTTAATDETAVTDDMADTSAADDTALPAPVDTSAADDTTLPAPVDITAASGIMPFAATGFIVYVTEVANPAGAVVQTDAASWVQVNNPNAPDAVFNGYTYKVFDFSAESALIAGLQTTTYFNVGLGWSATAFPSLVAGINAAAAANGMVSIYLTQQGGNLTAQLTPYAAGSLTTDPDYFGTIELVYQGAGTMTAPSLNFPSSSDPVVVSGNKATFAQVKNMQSIGWILFNMTLGGTAYEGDPNRPDGSTGAGSSDGYVVFDATKALLQAQRNGGTATFYLREGAEPARLALSLTPFDDAVTLTPSAAYTFPARNFGYASGAVAPHSVTVANTGAATATGLLALRLSGANAADFTLSAATLGPIAPGANAAFTVRPNQNLAVGVYAATVTVESPYGAPASFTVSFTVNAVAGAAISLNPGTDKDFGVGSLAYTPPDPFSVTVGNAGGTATGALTVALSGAGMNAFTLSKTDLPDIAVGGDDVFTVQPISGLGLGTHTATVTVSNAANSVSESFEVTFTVVAGIKVTNPRVTVSGTEFKINDGTDTLFFVGGNTPWNNWNDFGSQWGDQWNKAWWDNHFAQLKAAGANATRVWINCDAWGGPVLLKADGTFDRLYDAARFYGNADDLFELAAKHQIYIMATLMSFDHTSANASNNSYLAWRAMLNDTAAMQSVIDGYIVPFAERYADNPYFWSIDICNEPEWMNENASGGNIPMARITEFMARASAAIHQSANKGVLVTVGSAAIKWNSDGGGMVGNFFSDARMTAIAGDDAKLDFWSPHHYAWCTPYWGRPTLKTPTAFWNESAAVLKPAVIGECPGNSEGASTLALDYADALNNGWQGLLAWSTNGVDGAGNLTSFLAGVNGFYSSYPEQKLLLWDGTLPGEPDPGTTPPDPGTTPPGPGTTPPGPGTTPPGPGTTPPDPGTEPPGPGTTPPGPVPTPGPSYAANSSGGSTSDERLAANPAAPIKTEWQAAVKEGAGDVVALTVQGAAKRDGHLSFTVTHKIVSEMERVLNENKTGAAVSIEINFESVERLQQLTFKVEKSALTRLNKMEARLTVQMPDFRFDLDKETIAALKYQAKGAVRLSVSPVGRLSADAKSAIGGRPAYRFITTDANGKAVYDYGTGKATYALRYTPAPGEAPDSLRIAWIKEDELVWLDTVYEDGWLIWTGEANNAYGVGLYSAD